MTQEDTRQLKTALGLENLKGLGSTLKEIQALKETIEETQQSLAELAKENSPLGRALARLVEAHGLKALEEGNVNVLEEVKKNMEDELKGKEERIEGLEAENKGLREDKVVSDVTSKVTAELDKRLPKPGESGNGSGGSKLMKALEDVVAEYLQKRLLGGEGEGALTGEQIRAVVKEEVAKGLAGNKGPEDMVENIVNAVTMGDRLRDKLNLPGGVSHLLPAAGGDSTLRTDVMKILLEDERERLKIAQDHEDRKERNKHLGTLAGVVQEHLGDGIAALKVAAEEIKATGSKPPAPQQQTFQCGDCGTPFTAPAGWAGQPIKCPNPNCGREYTKEELLG